MAFVPPTKRVRMREVSGDAIMYEGPDHMEPYLRALFAQLPLATDKFTLVSDFAKHRTSLARAIVDVTHDEAPEPVLRALQAIPGARSKLVNYVTQCYFFAHRKAALHSDDAVIAAARHLWALFMHVYRDAARRAPRVAQEETRAILEHPSDTLAFCVFATARGEPVAVSSDAVQSFSVRLHWQAVSSAVTAFYAFPYSNAMYVYLRALTLRHAQLLAGSDIDGDDMEERALVYDHPLYCSPQTGRPFLRLGDDQRVVLNDKYLGDTETLLGAQLVRMTRVRWLLELATVTAPAPRPVLDHAPLQRSWVESVKTFVEALAKHDKLRRDVVDKVRDRLSTTLLMHGETARFARAHPRQEPNADNTLATMRHNTYRLLPVMQNKAVAEFVHDALTAQLDIEAADPGEWATRSRPQAEPQALLVLLAATDTWLQYCGASQKFVSDRVHLEELHIGKDELDDTFARPPQRPCWIRCMRWSFVVSTTGIMLYAGTGVLGAYAAWLRALFDERPDNGRGEKLNDRAIHAAWRPLLQTPSLVPLAAASASAISVQSKGVAYF